MKHEVLDEHEKNPNGPIITDVTPQMYLNVLATYY
jgi:hypothetical protein